MIFTLVYDPDDIMRPGFQLNINDMRQELINRAWPNGTLWKKEGIVFEVQEDRLINTKSREEYVI